MSQIKVNTIVDAAGGTTATINGYTPTVSNMATGNNRIINGAMMIDQRNAGASINGTGYSVDRWQFAVVASAKVSAQQLSSTPPAGFVNYVRLTSLAATTSGSTDYYDFQQNIEANNTSDLGFGTADAKSITVSFWARSSLTGLLGGVFGNYASTRAYPFTFNISVANTWQYVTVVIPGDTTGTWVTSGNGGSCVLRFDLGNGSSHRAAAGSWTGTASIYGPTGIQDLVGTSGATLDITGVQLEAGSVATPFEHRQYGQELALCERYYQRITALNSYQYISNWGSNASGTVFRTTFPLKTAIRAAVTSVDFSNLVVDDNGTVPGVTALVVYGSNTFDQVGLQATVSSGLTTFRPAVLASGVGTGFVGISAEL